jgi:hypothetical protein
MQIAIVAGELNNLFLMVGDISSSYLEAFTNEKSFVLSPVLKLDHLLDNF